MKPFPSLRMFPAQGRALVLLTALALTGLSIRSAAQPGFTVTIPNKTNVQCHGDSTGSAQAFAFGGQMPYSYIWNDPNTQTTATATGLPAGTWTITATDANAQTDTAMVTITEPTPIVITTSVSDATSCAGCDGSATATASGGNSPYTYQWDDPNFQNGSTATGLCPGIYKVVVRDANFCADSANVTVKNSGGSGLTLTTSANDATCGNNDGSASVNATGGSAPYSYQWNDPNTHTTQTATGLNPGTYTVVVTDANGCKDSATAQVNNVGGPALTTSSTDATCFGSADGTATVNATGGNAPYAYQWDDPASQTSATATGLAAGTYNVTVTDNSGCVSVAGVTISEPAELKLSLSETDIPCNGGSDGAVDLKPSGGTPSYTFTWSNAATTEDISGLTAGTYTVTVTDANMCMVTGSVTVGEPPLLTATTSVTNVSCNGDSNGAIDITVSGGVPGYTYNWSNGATTEDLSGLSAGNYCVTVTDANGCADSWCASLTQPPALSVASSATNASCAGSSDGSVDITVTGGTTPYVFAWSNGATTEDIAGVPPGGYGVTVTDANGCTKTASDSVASPAAISITSSVTNSTCGNADGLIDITVSGGSPAYTYLWSNGATTQDAGGLVAGNYTVTVTDNNGCTATKSDVVNDTGGPAPITHTSVNVSCNGGSDGSIDITVGGGAPPYGYTWSNGATSQDITGLTAGTYNVTVTDNNNCVALYAVDISEPPVLAVSLSGTPSMCSGENAGTIDATATGGSPSYSYLWSNGVTTEDITGLTAGTYTMTVTDANGCTTTASETITDPSPIVLSISKTDVSCNGASDGSATVIASGGTPGYVYLWNDPDGQTGSTATGLLSGTYRVTVTDVNGCADTASATIGGPAAIAATTVATDATCNGGKDGSIDLTASGGAGGFTFAWSNGATTEDISGLGAGTYTVTINDANGCTQTASETVGEAAAISLSTTPSNASCGSPDGSINLTVSGGNPAYTFTWNNGVTTEDVSGLAAGTYTVTVTDSAGCTAVKSENVSETGGVTLINDNTTDVSCNGGSDGAIDITPIGGAPPYTYTWSNGATAQDITGLSAGSYTVTVTSGGCNRIKTMTVAEPAPLATTMSSTDESCPGCKDGTAGVTVTGGTAPYVYLWDDPGAQTSATATGLGAGIYHVTVTDANGCTTTDSVTVSVSVGLAGGTDNSPVTAWPNPTSSILHLKGGKLNDLLAVSVYDMTGRMAVRTGATTSLDLSEVPAGIYLIKLDFSDNTNQTIRLYKH